MKAWSNRLNIYWLLLMILIGENHGDDKLCHEEPISGMLCWKMFPTRVLNPQDVPRPKLIPDTTCAYTLQSDSLTITGSTTDKYSPNFNSCDFIPSNNSRYTFTSDTTSKVTNLAILNTNIITLRKGVFSTWSNVQILQINMNYKLQRIEPGAFENLLNVYNLTIGDNPKLKIIEENTFSGLENLGALRYLRNNLKQISHLSFALQPSILPNLTVLNIIGDYIPKINKDAFKAMKNSKLNTLEISLTKTDWIDEEAFDPLGPLVGLILSRNNLNTSILTPLLNNSVMKDNSLNNLEIYQNALGEDIKPLLETLAQNVSSITYLNLRNNHIGIMRPGFFPKMSTLEELDLSDVMIDDLSEGVISKELMPNLQKLYLGGNLFSGIKPYMVPETLTILDLSNNEDDLPWTTTFKIEPRVFAKIPNLKLLNLSGNKINILRRHTLKEATALEVLFLSGCFVNTIEEGAFLTNSKMFYLDLSSNSFPIINPFKKEIFQGLSNLIALDLSDCHISVMHYDDVFFYLKNLQYLSLRMNAILQLSPATFSRMPFLYTIDLRYNIMVSWNKRIFRNNIWLNYTYLDNNHIETITDAMMEDFLMSKSVKLYSNSLACDCKLVKTVNKVIQSGRIADVTQLPFEDATNICINRKETLTNFLSRVKPDQCKDKRWITVLSVTLGTLVLTSIVAYVIYYYYKYDIHFWFLKTKRRLGLLQYIGSKKTDKPNGFKYDAFVSYCIEDERFVEKMVYILETEKFNLCVFERDFKVGDVLTDRIVHCMESSRRTILVLTESFAKSQWCCWEMYMAQSRSISLRDPDSKDSLVLIKKSHIPDSLMTPTLRHLMKTRVYLEWHHSPIRQKIFWEQLKNTLRNKQ